MQQLQRGAALLIFMILVVMAAMAYLVNGLTPEMVEAMRQKKTEAAMAQAKDALIGYALRYREDQIADGQYDRMYGYLPLPDLGTSRNNNTDPNCKDASNNPIEGCEAANFSGNALNTTVIGRLPWRTLGIPPLHDGAGECLWYIVSGSHQRQQRVSPMNWDMLGQLDIVVANGTSNLASTLAIPHERPIAIIFAAGTPLTGQDRSTSITDDVAQCGGNYTASNYLDPNFGSGVIGSQTNYFPSDSYSDTLNDTVVKQHRYASAITGDSDASNDPDAPKNLLTQGKLFISGGNYLPNGCQGNDCTLASNDVGLPITGDTLFGTIRKHAYFRTDINAMLDRMVSCLRDEIAAGGSLAAYGKIAGADNNSCYGKDIDPRGYYTHYKEMIFVATPGSPNVTMDGVLQPSCVGALLFAGQRDTSVSQCPPPPPAPPTALQQRFTATDRAAPCNYLEGTNLQSFANSGTSFSGASLLGLVKASKTNPADITRCTSGGVWAISSACHTAEQDIVHCIPAGYSLSKLDNAPGGTSNFALLANYSYDLTYQAGTLTLGSQSAATNYAATAANLFGCSWTPEIHAGGSGVRSYFRLRIRKRGEGFTFSVIDGDRNSANACGAAGEHLGYSGQNAFTPSILPPKLAVEFDLTRNNGRNDPCYQYSCGASQNLQSNAHVAAVYWGYQNTNDDDNVHGYPVPPDSSPHPAPQNPTALMPYLTPAPDPAPGVAPYDRMGGTDGAKRDLHARIEVTRAFNNAPDAKDGATNVTVKLWIDPQLAASISSMTWNAGTPPTLSITAASHGLNTNDLVVIKDAVPAGLNGEYVVTKIDNNNFTATLPNGTPNPGAYISKITWSGNVATVTSPNHGLITGDIITIANAFPSEYNVTKTVTWLSANSYKFPLALPNDPGDLEPAIAAAKAFTPLAIKLATTTRPMNELDSTAKPVIMNSATIYDEQKSACAADSSCPTGQACGSDNFCYQPSFRNLRMGFTMGERRGSTTNARNQLIYITDYFSTWIP